MFLVPAKPQISWLTLGLSTSLIFIGVAPVVPGSAIRGAEIESKTASAAPASDTSADAGEIRGLIAKYAQAVDDADTALVSQIWSNTTEVSFIHPLGHEHGLEQIKQNVFEHLMGEVFSERKLSLHDISIHAYGDAAWAEFYWDFAAKFRKDGAPITTHGRETQVYHKEQGRWRLVHVHYSPMPAAEARKGF
jgi:ketosteroid isomerase-like protein